MSGFLEAAYQLLKEFDRPMYCHELTQIAIDRRILITHGKTPVATMASLLYTDIRKNGSASQFIKIGSSLYALNNSSYVQQVYNDILATTTKSRKYNKSEKHVKDIKAQRAHGLLDQEITLIQTFLNGRNEQPQTCEKICDWVNLCYSLELFIEGAELFCFVDAAEVNEWYYERTKKMARLCTLHENVHRG